MSERLVQYLVVAGAREGEPRRKTLTGQSELACEVEVEGYVQQRLPSKDWPGYSLPAGIERFCRPLGWFLSTRPSCPRFVNFILTQETGSSLFCSSLNFYQPNRKMPNKKRNSDEKLLTNISRSTRSRSAVSGKRKSALIKKEHSEPSTINLSAIEVSLDEECENHHFSLRSLMTAEDMYEPVSLCLVSKYPLFDALQALLKSIYIYWATGSKPLEPLVAELLVELRFPLGNKPPHKRSFGPLHSLTLPPLSIVQTLPYTSDSTFMLLKTVGVSGLLHLFAAILSDCKLLFISSSMTALTSAMMALRAIIYPLDLNQFTRVLIPAGLEPLVQAPTPFIHGMHESLLEELDEEPPEVIMINLDNGEVKIPEDVQLTAIPLDLLKPMRTALNRVLDPSWEDYDNVFVRSTPTKSSYWKDKAVRAVFTSAFLYLLGGYRHHATVLRFHPVAKFHYNNEAYLARFCVGEDQETWKNFMQKFCETIGFITFTRGERMLPFRVCDFFDELIHRFDSESIPMTLAKLFSAGHIQKLADEMEQLLPISAPEKPTFDCQDASIAEISDGPAPYRFSELIMEEVESLSDDLELRWKGPANTPATDAMSYVPMLEMPPTKNLRLKRSPSLVMKDRQCLSNCLAAIFNNKIIEARKYLPSVTLYLKQSILTDVFVPELVNKLLECGGLLVSEQFELLVRLVNSAMGDENTAVAILPLLTVFYREVQPGINQYMFTCVQKHEVWSDEEFWCSALYKAVQSELVRVYSEFPVSSRRRSGSIVYRQLMSAKSSSTEEGDENIDGNDDDDNFYNQEEDAMMGEVTLRSRQRVRSLSPSRMRNTARNVAHSKDARMRIRANTLLPSLSEGMLPPDAQPVNAYEALHHLSKRMSAWPDLSEEERSKLTMQEENAIKNQIILFINRIINMRTPVDFSKGAEETQQFTRSLIEFIGHFLSRVETDLSLHYSREGQAHIMDQMGDMIQIHLDSLRSLRQLIQKVPLAKAKVAKPPRLYGETMIVDGVHAFLLLDGRSTGKLVPADGNVFVTSYRVIFVGTPCDTSVDPNLLVTRSMPIASIYRLKELNQVAVPSLVLVLPRGIQLRSTTAELIKLGFDEDISLADFKVLSDKIQSLRYPREIVRGLQEVITPTVTIQQDVQIDTRDPLCKKQRKSVDVTSIVEHVDHTQLKLISSISQSPYCLEYERLDLGSLIKSKSKGHWKLNKANLNFVLCNSYPAIWVMAESIQGEFLQRVSKQFVNNRLPVVTWKHSKNSAVLLRSASFVAPVIRKKPVSRALTRQVTTDDLEQVGVLSTDVDAFISEIVKACPHVNEDLHASLQSSIQPPSLMFVNEADAEESIRSRLASQGSQDSLQLRGSSSSNEDSPESQRRKKSSSKGMYQSSLYAALDNVIQEWDLRTSPELFRTISEEQPMTMPGGNDGSSGQPAPLLSMSSIGPLGIVSEDNTPMSPIDLEPPLDMLESDDTDAQSQHSQELGDVFGKDIGNKKEENAHVRFASLPTNPRDWIVMDALPKEIQHWESKGLYVIGDKLVLQRVRPDMYQDCTFVPVEVPSHSDIATSFTKLQKACVPSQNHSPSHHHSKLFSLVEESEWLNQLSLILQLAAAVADLIDSQGSSVLVCLENGWDATAQVVSLAQLLMDPYYRTIDGFRLLVEKDWLAFGHPFSRRGHHVTDCDQADMSPVFLQFLDCVHQVHRQFPTAFEFNDFYLKVLAYHHASMRFHTFTLNSEKERCSKNWLPYRPRPAAIHGGTATEPYASLWEYINQLHVESSMFYNFLYQPQEDQEMLHPHSYQANLDIWSFYLDNLISQFPPYDTELITDGPLTLTDLHYGVFPNNAGGITIDPPVDAFSEIRQLLREYTDLINALCKARGYGFIPWKQLWDQLVVQSEKSCLPTTPVKNLIMRDVREHMFRVQCANMQKATSMAVLIKGKLALEMEENYRNPHCFEKKMLFAYKRECQFCHHPITETTAYKCKQCRQVCHAHCYPRMPHNCGVAGDSQAVPEEDTDKAGHRHRSSTLIRGKSKKMQDLHECEGYLYKKGGIVKNWKLRYFVLDTEKRHLAYYNKENDDSKLCGKIPLNDIVTLEQCEAMNVPVLKAGQAGFFFKLTTNRRVFHLMALRGSSRNVWMQKINAARQNKNVDK